MIFNLLKQLEFTIINAIIYVKLSVLSTLKQ